MNKKEYMKAYYKKHKEKPKEKERIKKYRENHKEEMKKWRAEHKEKLKAYYKKWKKEHKGYMKEWGETNKGLINEYEKKRRINQKKELKARNLARYHIPIPKGYLCEVCDKELATQRHHKDYDKPLAVDLVCQKCHTKLDKIKNKLNTWEKK